MLDARGKKGKRLSFKVDRAGFCGLLQGKLVAESR